MKKRRCREFQSFLSDLWSMDRGIRTKDPMAEREYPGRYACSSGMPQQFDIKVHCKPGASERSERVR